jgi:hypothetical protein
MPNPPIGRPLDVRDAIRECRQPEARHLHYLFWNRFAARLRHDMVNIH